MIVSVVDPVAVFIVNGDVANIRKDVAMMLSVRGCVYNMFVVWQGC